MADYNLKIISKLVPCIRFLYDVAYVTSAFVRGGSSVLPPIIWWGTDRITLRISLRWSKSRKKIRRIRLEAPFWKSNLEKFHKSIATFFDFELNPGRDSCTIMAPVACCYHWWLIYILPFSCKYNSVRTREYIMLHAYRVCRVNASTIVLTCQKLMVSVTM